MKYVYHESELKTYLIGSAIFNFILSLMWKLYRPNMSPFNSTNMPKVLNFFAFIYAWVGIRGTTLRIPYIWLAFVILAMFKTMIQIKCWRRLDNFGWLLLNNGAQSIIFGLIYRTTLEGSKRLTLA